MKKVILALFGLGFVITGCKKESSSGIQNPSPSISLKTQNSYDQLGQIHNEALLKLSNKIFLMDTLESQESVKQAISDIVINDLQYLSDSTFDEGFMNYSWLVFDSVAQCSFDVVQCFGDSLSSDGIGFIRRIDDLIDSMAVFDIRFNIIENEIDLLINDIAGSNLSGSELEIVYAYVYISKYSTEFWAPTRLGGMGMYDQYMVYHTNRGSAPPSSWERAKDADAAASATYMLSSSIGLAAGWIPGVGLGWLGGWGVSTAISSCFNYFK